MRSSFSAFFSIPEALPENIPVLLCHPLGVINGADIVEDITDAARIIAEILV